MRKQSVFSFESYDINPNTKEISLNYKLSVDSETHIFTEKLFFPKDKKWRNVPDEVLQPALQALHLAAGVSYWKAYCPKNIVVRDASLAREQADFWNRLYTKGLGEFFYKNKIDFRKLVSFPSFAKASEGKPSSIKTDNRSLLLFGGGKDSLVSAELLKKGKKKFDFFYVASGKESNVIMSMLPKSAVIVRRQIDSKIIELNSKGAYNGHIPITALINFIAELAAILYGYRNVIVSNERSADYGNVKYLGGMINHQWSKSMEFEKMLQDYSKKFITPSITNFSLLRPFYEIKIIEFFSHFGSQFGKGYFNKFSSCNRNFKVFKERLAKNRLWCGECPKCAFVFAMLSAYLPKKKIVAIFGKNMFADKSLLPLFAELLGIRKIKPFECVGTPEEVIYAFSMAAMGGEYAKNPVMMMFGDKVIISAWQLKMLEKDLFCNGNHLIPKEFIKIIRKT